MSTVAQLKGVSVDSTAAVALACGLESSSNELIVPACTSSASELPPCKK